MKRIESKNEKFRRLAMQRGGRAIKDLQLLGNLSNRNNYVYSENEIRQIFSSLEAELKRTKSMFISSKKREIKF